MASEGEGRQCTHTRLCASAQSHGEQLGAPPDTSHTPVDTEPDRAVSTYVRLRSREHAPIVHSARPLA